MIKVTCIQRVLPEYRISFFEELSKKFDLKIIYGTGSSGGAQKNADDLSSLPVVKCWNLKLHLRNKNMDYFISIFPGLFFLIRRERPDVILTEGATNILNNFIVYFYSFLYRVPVVWWDAGRDINQKLGKLRRILEFLLVFFQNRSNAILSYTDGGRSYFESNGVKKENIFVINNYSSVDAAPDLVGRVLGLRRLLMIPEGKKVFLIIGAIERRKLISEFILEASKSEMLRNGAEFIFVGDGPEKNHLNKMAIISGLSCHFVGAVYKGKDAFYSLSDALVLPGWSTLAIVESLKFEKPAFVAEFGGPEHIFIEEGVTGMKHDKNNLGQLIKNLEIFIEGNFSPDFSSNKLMARGVKEMAGNAAMAINHCLIIQDAR
jgi:glycosyltransferase involved in cell wall biosynthesis